MYTPAWLARDSHGDRDAVLAMSSHSGVAALLEMRSRAVTCLPMSWCSRVANWSTLPTVAFTKLYDEMYGISHQETSSPVTVEHGDDGSVLAAFLRQTPVRPKARPT